MYAHLFFRCISDLLHDFLLDSCFSILQAILLHYAVLVFLFHTQ